MEFMVYDGCCESVGVVTSCVLFGTMHKVNVYFFKESMLKIPLKTWSLISQQETGSAGHF